MSDWAIIIAAAALVFSIFTFFTKALDKNTDKSLSIREHEAYKAAVDRDIHRVEGRLGHIEQTRPTTGELEILAEALNKRMDAIDRKASH